MTREEARKAAEVMLAYANGAQIEYKDAITGKWSANKEPNFNWFTFDYRIKSKQEKFDPKTLQPFDKVLCRLSFYNKWQCNLFSNICTNNDNVPCPFYNCMGNLYMHVIPYNDETKHLLGTIDEAPEFYRYWEE